MSRRTRPRRQAPGSGAPAINTTFESGTKAPVGGYYSHDSGQPTHHRKGRVLPEIGGEVVVWRLLQICSEKARFRAKESKGFLVKTGDTLKGLVGKAVDFAESHPNITTAVVTGIVNYQSARSAKPGDESN